MTSATESTGPPNLAARLGYGADDRVLIVNCDDLCSSHAANVGCYDALRDGVATSSTLMVPCPWAREAAARYRGEDVGVHLTLNAEWDLYRWGPITRAPSLLDGDGGFPRTVEDVWDHADMDEVRRELSAQVERAILWGFDVSHLDTHMGTLQSRPEFFDVYLELAVEFRLPLRLAGASAERVVGFPFRRLAAEEGVVFPDSWAPPMITVRGIRSTIRGSRRMASAMLLSGPTGTSTISSVAARYVSIRNSAARRACLTDRGGGIGSSRGCMLPSRWRISRGIGKSSRSSALAAPS